MISTQAKVCAPFMLIRRLLPSACQLNLKIVPSSVAAMSNSSSSPTYFVTDSEGNLDSLLRPLIQARAIDLLGNPLRHFKLVFGGDAVSRGRQDLRLLHYFRRLEEHPFCDGLVRIVGNRDTMLFRLQDALHPTRLLVPLRDKSLFFASVPATAECELHAQSEYGSLPNAPSLDVIRAEAKCLLDSIGKIADEGQKQTELAEVHLNDLFRQLAMVRLRVLLQYTMGSPQAFELRRRELSEIGQPHSDWDVLASFEGLIAPNGSLTSHCLKAEIAHIQGRTLFIHGSLTGDIVTHIQGRRVDVPLREWVQKYNNITRVKLHQYCAEFQKRSRYLFEYYFTHHGQSLAFWEENGGFGYSPVHDVVATSMARVGRNQTNPSPIYSTYNQYYKPGVPQTLDSVVAAKLAEAGIDTIVCGHNPHGDGAVTLKLKGTTVENNNHEVHVHVVDNAYAANTRFANNLPRSSPTPPSSTQTVSASALSSQSSPFSSHDPHAHAKPFAHVRHDEDPRGVLSSSMFSIDAEGNKWLSGTLSNGIRYANRIGFSCQNSSASVKSSSHAISNPISSSSSSSSPSSPSPECLIGTKLRVSGLELLVKHVLADGSLVAADTHGFVVINYRLQKKHLIHPRQEEDQTEWQVVSWPVNALAAERAKL